MGIKLRAQRILNGGVVEQDISTTIVIGDPSGIQFRCESETLEIVIDGQAVKVAKIKELLEMKSRMAELIGIDNSELSDGDVVDLLIELINNIGGEDND